MAKNNNIGQAIRAAFAGVLSLFSMYALTKNLSTERQALYNRISALGVYDSTNARAYVDTLGNDQVQAMLNALNGDVIFSTHPIEWTSTT